MAKPVAELQRHNHPIPVLRPIDQLDVHHSLRDLLHVLLGSEALQIRVYQGFAVVQAVGQGEENINLKYRNSNVLMSNINLEWVHL